MGGVKGMGKHQSLSMPQRFWSRAVEDENGCWVWARGRHHDGYGAFFYEGQRVYAHRLAWQLARGEIPKGLLVLHRCDNPPCINPKHLFLGTRRDNALDRDKKGRNVTSSGEKNGSAKLSESDVVKILEGLSQGETRRALARRFDISPSMVTNIYSRKNWKSISR
jgi:HNH endonuclease